MNRCRDCRVNARRKGSAPFLDVGSERGDDTVGNPHRTQISQFELFELILLLKLDKRQRFEASASQSTVPSPSLIGVAAPLVASAEDVSTMFLPLMLLYRTLVGDRHQPSANSHTVIQRLWDFTRRLDPVCLRGVISLFIWDNPNGHFPDQELSH